MEVYLFITQHGYMNYICADSSYHAYKQASILSCLIKGDVVRFVKPVKGV